MNLECDRLEIKKTQMDRTVTIALEENPARQDIETLNNAIYESSDRSN
jgi:hypothetical protein